MTTDARKLILPIEGLRGVAVAVVILYHLDLRGFSGGFVGVDIFFVISGFLISGLLLQEFDETRTISIRNFYIRRARRILPAATFVLVGTMLSSRLFLEPLRLINLTVDGISASTFWINVQLAAKSIDYLDSALPPSPLQHYWSLAVEEQFYLVFPVLLYAILRVNRRRDTAVAVLTLLALLSFVGCLVFTEQSQPLAFFLSPFRAWQFLLGTVLPLLISSRSQMRRIASEILSLGGLGLVSLSVVVGHNSQYPGSIALVPTVGAALLLSASHSTSLINQLLSSRLALIVGRRSYVLYLWHWPVTLFVKSNSDGTLKTWDLLLVLCLTTLLSEVTHRLIETPFRLRDNATQRIQPVLLVASCVLLGVGASAMNHISRPTDFGAGVISPLTTKNRVEYLALALQMNTLPENVEPTLESVFTDEPDVYRLGCHDYASDTPRICAVGDPSSQTKMALVGDSHAAQWFEPLKQIALAENWSLQSITRSGCSTLGTLTPESCRPWLKNVFERLARERFSIVVISSLINGTEYSDDELRRGLVEMRDRVIALGATPVFIADTPRPESNVPICISQNDESLQNCNLARDRSISQDLERVSQSVFSVPKSGFIETSSWFCIKSLCPSVVGTVVVYRDESHIATGYAVMLVDELRMALKQVNNLRN